MIYFVIIFVCLMIFGICYLCIRQIEKMNNREYEIEIRKLEIEMRRVAYKENRLRMEREQRTNGY